MDDSAFQNGPTLQNMPTLQQVAGMIPADGSIRRAVLPETAAPPDTAPRDAALGDAAPGDAAIAAFRDFLIARRRYNRLPAEAGQADPAGAAAAWGAYDRADAAMREAPIASARGARAALSYLLIGLESFEPGSWSTPVFHNMMRFLRRLPAERR